MANVEAPQANQPNHDSCSRCLQPVPPKTARCPNCGTQIHSAHRRLPLAIGFIGLFALAFIMLVMYRMVGDEDMAKAPTLVDQGAQTQDDVLRDGAPDSGRTSNSDQPSKPDKPPPLNEH